MLNHASHYFPISPRRNTRWLQMPKHILWLLALGVSFFIPRQSKASDLEWDIIPQRNYTNEIENLREDRLKIMWWNINYGDFSKKTRNLTGRKISPLDSNLRIIVQNPKLRPQILVLGEFKAKALHPQTRAILESIYPYRTYFPLNELHPEIAEMVYSSIKPETTQQIYLPWYPQTYVGGDPDQGVKSEATHAFIKSWTEPYPTQTQYFARTLNQYRIFFRGFTFDIFPVHLVQPWFGYKFGETWTGGLLPTINKSRNIIWGKDNPLWYQVDAMRMHLRKLLGQGYAQKQYVIVTGDLNLPGRLPQSRWGFSPEMYERAKGFLKDPLENVSQFSFPAASTDVQLSRFKNQLRIDHAFISQPLTSDFAEILPIAGSDHYPLYISVFP